MPKTTAKHLALGLWTFFGFHFFWVALDPPLVPISGWLSTTAMT